MGGSLHLNAELFRGGPPEDLAGRRARASHESAKSTQKVSPSPPRAAGTKETSL